MRRWRKGAKAVIQAMDRIATRGLRVVIRRTSDLYPWQVTPMFGGSFVRSPLPSGAREYLVPDNPRLLELIDRYKVADPRVTTPTLWSEGMLSREELLYFRGDNPFVWQKRGRDQNELSYALTYYFTLASGCDDLLACLPEDDLFGIHTFAVGERIVSRDVLDSAREIQFLMHNVGIGQGAWNILDIGAGYGRLPLRLNQATGEDVRIYATDAFAPSTFISEFYLRTRGADRTEVVALDVVDHLLERVKIDVAINIHSFSECTMEAIAWWVERLANNGVRYLMVVPNFADAEGRCLTNQGVSMEPIFKRFGYAAKVREPRYADPLVQKYGIDPAHLSLFERA